MFYGLLFYEVNFMCSHGTCMYYIIQTIVINFIIFVISTLSQVHEIAFNIVEVQ